MLDRCFVRRWKVEPTSVLLRCKLQSLKLVAMASIVASNVVRRLRVRQIFDVIVLRQSYRAPHLRLKRGTLDC